MAPRPASGGFLEVQQRVDGLLRRDHVVFGAGLRDRDEFPEQVRPFGRSDPRPVFFRSDFVAGLLSRQTPAAYWSSSLPRPGRQIRGVLPQVRRQPSASATRTHNAAISASCSASYFRSRAFAVRNQGASPGGPSVLNTCAVHYSRSLSDQRDTPGWLRRTTRAHPDGTAIQLRSRFFAETRMAGDRRRSRNPTGPP